MNNSVFGFDKAEDSPGFLLWQTTIIWQRLINKALLPYAVSHTQFVILANLLWFEEKQLDSTQVMIARSSKLDKMTVSKALKAMVDQGLVKREEHEKDTRAKSVCLTKKGKALALKLVPIVEAVDEDFFGSVTAVEYKSLIKIFNKLILAQEE